MSRFIAVPQRFGAIIFVVFLLSIGSPGAFPAGQPAQSSGAASDLFVTAGKSLVVDSPVNIQRVSVANSLVAEAGGGESQRGPCKRQGSG